MANLIKKYGWNEWLSKTNFSFLTGSSSPKEMLSKALSLEYHGLSINDLGGVYGLARSYSELSQLRSISNQANLNLYYGCEINLKEDHDAPILLQENIAFIARNNNGYKNLCTLISQSHRYQTKKTLSTNRNIIRIMH